MSATTLTSWSTATSTITIIIIVVINTASSTDLPGLGRHYHPDCQPLFGPIAFQTHLGPTGSATEDGHYIFRPFATFNPGIDPDPDLDPDLGHIRFDYRPGNDAVDDLVGSMNTSGLPREATPAL